MTTPQDLLLSLSRAYSLAEIHFSGDPELNDGLETVRRVQEAVGWIVVRVRPDFLTVKNEVMTDEHGEIQRFRDTLEAAWIQEMRLQNPPDPGALEDFLRRLHPSYPAEANLPSARFRGLERVMGLSFRLSEGHLSGMSGSIQGLFQHKGMTPEEDKTSSEVIPEAAAAEATTDLVEEARRFLEGSGTARNESADRIRDEASRLRENRDMNPVLDLVEHLAESAGDGPGDPEVLELVSTLVTPGLASLFLSRLASARDDHERERLIGIAPRLGREVAEALADALVEARDRRDRRSFMDALVGLGPMGMEMAARMAEDSRWYVVRNGVSVLGEIAGEEAVLHLTATLGNADARVRKETVSALAKVGGEDASLLLLGMLDDPEPEVRSATCRSLGILKVERAVRPLLRILGEDSDTDVQVETLQALGQIGDPGAVPLIEKKAVGGFLRRPPQEVRIAAFRGLAGIGTPHAKDLLRKAISDRDPRVRTTVKTLLLSG
jgi:hypothetical protein